MRLWAAERTAACQIHNPLGKRPRPVGLGTMSLLHDDGPNSQQSETRVGVTSAPSDYPTAWAGFRIGHHHRPLSGSRAQVSSIIIARRCLTTFH